MFFREPASNMLHLDVFNFNPAIKLKLSNVFMSVSKDFCVPSIIKVASSAKSVFFISLLLCEFLEKKIEKDNNSIHIMNI